MLYYYDPGCWISSVAHLYVNLSIEVKSDFFNIQVCQQIVKIPGKILKIRPPETAAYQPGSLLKLNFDIKELLVRIFN